MSTSAAPDVAKALATTNTAETTIAPSRAILYALGVGAKRNELDVVYEGSPEFKVLPTMGVIPAFDVMWENKWTNAVPKFDPVSIWRELRLVWRTAIWKHGKHKKASMPRMWLRVA